MPLIFHAVRRPAALLAALAACSVAAGQTTPQNPPVPPPESAKAPPAAELQDPRLTFTLVTGGLHRFENNIDDGGKVAVSSFGLNLTGKYKFSDDFTLSTSLGYSFSQYDFTGTTGFGGLAPWDQVHTVRLSVTGAWDVAPHWTVFGGGTGAFSGEDDADFGDGVTGGGILGATYAWDKKTYLGLGLLVTSSIEDNAAVYPILRFSLPLTDSLTFRNATVSVGAAGGAGAELAWEINDQWSLGLSAQYVVERFRLDDVGPQPSGVGQDSFIPILIRGSWSPRKDVSLTVFGGAILGASVRLDDMNGNKIADQDIDPTPVLGIALDLKF